MWCSGCCGRHAFVVLFVLLEEYSQCLLQRGSSFFPLADDFFLVAFSHMVLSFRSLFCVVSYSSVLMNSLMSSTHRFVRLPIFVCAFNGIITPGFHSAALLVHWSSLCEEVLMEFLLCFPIQFPILNVCIFLLLLWCSS